MVETGRTRWKSFESKWSRSFKNFLIYQKRQFLSAKRVPFVCTLTREASHLTTNDLNEIWCVNRSTCIITVIAIIAVDSKPVTSKIVLKLEIIAASRTHEQWASRITRSWSARA